jgi:hypothetical protein
MEVVISFFLGVLFGGSLFTFYGFLQARKLEKAKESLIAQLKDKAKELDEKRNSIADRLKKASELAQQQLALKAQMEAPSQNGLHSRYKNGLAGEIYDMEEEKLQLLRTVLAEGFDPMITIINESGTREEVPLSAYVNQASGMLNENHGTKLPTTPTDPNQPRKAGKFVVYKGGKDDGTTH